MDKVKFLSFFTILGFVFSFILCIIFRVSFLYLLLRVILSTGLMAALGFLCSFLYEKYLFVELSSTNIGDAEIKQKNDDINFDKDGVFNEVSKSTIDSLENDIAQSVLDKNRAEMDARTSSGFDASYESLGNKIKKEADILKEQFDGEIMAKAIRKEIKED